MMTSDGHATMMEKTEDGYKQVFKSNYPIPEGCDAKKILKALEKLADTRPPIKITDARLLPLTPMEKGFVLGALTEYHSKK